MNKSATVLKALLKGLEVELNGVTVKLFKAGDNSPFNDSFVLEAPFLAQKSFNVTFNRHEWLVMHDFGLLDFIGFAESMPDTTYAILIANLTFNTVKL